MSRRYVLVGSGIAALAAAEAIREADPTGRVTLVGNEPHPFYSRPGLAYFLDRTLPASRLAIRSQAEVDALRLERIHGPVRRIDPAGRKAILDDARRIPYDCLLLAMGAASIPPTFAGSGLDGVVTLDGMDGALDLVRRTRALIRTPRAVVAGGGSTALEIAEGLHARGVETHYLLRGERYWSRVLDQVESDVVLGRLAAAGVRVHRNTEVQRANGRKDRLQEVLTSGGDRLGCTICAVAIGVRPRTRLAVEAGLEVERGIVTDEFLRTGAPGVFAAGDVAQVRNPETGRADLDTLWQSALQQGRAAGLTMAGVPTTYRPRAPLNVTRLAGLTTTIVGEVGGDEDPDLLTLTRGQSERWRSAPGRLVFTGQQGGDRVRVLVGDRTIAGALIMGDQAPARSLVRLVMERIDISPVRGLLLQDPANAVGVLIRHEQQQARGGRHAGAA